MGAASEPGAEPRSRRALFLVVLALAWIGLLVALYLAYRGAHPAAAGLCGPDSGCDEVLSSRYAVLAGIPLAWAGSALYALVLALVLVGYGSADGAVYRRALAALRWASLLGALASGVMLYVQFGVIRAVCPLCTASAVIVAAIYFLSERLPRTGPPAAHRAPARYATLAVVSVTLLGATVFVLGQRSRVVARIGGEEITADQLQREMQLTLHDIEMRAWYAKRNWVLAKAEARALADEAERRGISVKALVESEIDSKVDVTDADIEAWIRSQELSDGERRARIRRTILADRRRTRRIEFLKSLPGEDWAMLLEPPRIRRVDIDLTHAERLGAEDAPAQLAVFSEFRCPHCAKLASVMGRLHERHPDKVQLAFLHFPLDGHSVSEDAAVASVCASRQGRFWAFHDLLFEAQIDLGEETVLDAVSRLGLDASAFEACRTSPATRTVVDANRRQAQRLGLREVPALFLNGRLIGGALEYEELERLVGEELREPWLSLVDGK